MNNYITAAAKSRIRDLLVAGPTGTLALGLSANPAGGFEITYVFTSGDEWSIMVSNSPYVVTNERTFSQLTDGSIDYDRQTDEFVITREPT